MANKLHLDQIMVAFQRVVKSRVSSPAIGILADPNIFLVEL